jgi:hypothetical protein
MAIMLLEPPLRNAVALTESTCVPRPTPPERVHYEIIDNDRWMADRANLDVADYLAHIKTPATRLIDDFVTSWRRQPTRGRKPEGTRNALINALAKLFHDKSGWQLRYQTESDIYLREYRTSLTVFLVSILAANGIVAPGDRVARLRMVDRRHRLPRA